MLLSHKSSEELQMISSQLKWYQMFTSSALRRRSLIMMFNWGMVNVFTVVDLHLCTGQVFSKENENESSNSHKQFEELMA